MGCNIANKEDGSLPQSEIYQVLEVVDGDILSVVKDSKEEKVRLCGIDAPELQQSLGKTSREKLRALVALSNNRVSLMKTNTDKDGRHNLLY